MDKKGILLLLQKLVVWVSFKRLILLFLVSVAGITSLTLFEERDVLIELWNSRDVATVPRQPDVRFSDGLQRQLTEAVTESSTVVGVTVHTVNLKINEKRLVFHYFEEPGLTQLFDNLIKSTGTSGSMFDSDQQNNLQMVSVVNGEFTCAKIESTQIYRTTSDVAQHAKTLCRISTPPFYGSFSGYVTFWIKQPPTEALSTQTRISIVRLSSEIYRELVMTRRLSQN